MAMPGEASVYIKLSPVENGGPEKTKLAVGDFGGNVLRLE